MGRFRNFSIWRGKLPHWRADGETYYVTFRHSRELELRECELLLGELIKPQGRKWDLVIVCVLPNRTEMMFTLYEGPDGSPFELSDIVEKAKRKAGAKVIKRSGERYPPFYFESYDRIVRDEAELAERWDAVLASPVEAELVDDPEQWPALWVANAP